MSKRVIEKKLKTLSQRKRKILRRRKEIDRIMSHFGFQSIFNELSLTIQCVATEATPLQTIVTAGNSLKDDPNSETLVNAVSEAVTFGRLTDPDVSFIPFNDLNNFIYICGQVCQEIGIDPIIAQDL